MSVGKADKDAARNGDQRMLGIKTVKLSECEAKAKFSKT
jgi:hypothetical protein